MKTENRFINTFVNEMYAILIGIGIGNILFGQGLDMTNIADLVMVFFVTTVVLKYWWDWTEYIADHVISSKKEFAIDFVILVLLEFLFAYYNQPLKLSIIFLGLALVNLVWVVNHLWEFKEQFKHRSKSWIIEKLLAILIYAIVVLSLIRFGDKLPHYIEVIIVITSYFVVRKVSFLQLKGKTKYHIEAAGTSHAAPIVELNNAAFKSDSPSGFMISKLAVDNVRKQIETGEIDYYVIYQKNREIIGFIEISQSAGQEIIDNIAWIDPDQETRFKNSEVRYIEKIVIREDLRNKNIGSLAYKYIFEKYQDLLLYAFIMISPVNNLASMQFHLKNNFVKSAVFTAKKHAGYKNYQSILMIKNKGSI